MAAPTPSKSILSPAEPVSLDDQIQRRAYERYVKRGGAKSDSGSELDDWLQAEKEILAAQEQPNPKAERGSMSAEPSWVHQASRRRLAAVHDGSFVYRTPPKNQTKNRALIRPDNCLPPNARKPQADKGSQERPGAEFPCSVPVLQISILIGNWGSRMEILGIPPAAWSRRESIPGCVVSYYTLTRI